MGAVKETYLYNEPPDAYDEYPYEPMTDETMDEMAEYYNKQLDKVQENVIIEITKEI